MYKGTVARVLPFKVKYSILTSDLGLLSFWAAILVDIVFGK